MNTVYRGKPSSVALRYDSISANEKFTYAKGEENKFSDEESDLGRNF